MLGTSASKNAARTGTAVIAAVTAAVLLAGCASKNSAADTGGKPPKLMIGTGSSGVAAAPMMAAAGGAAVRGAPAPELDRGFTGFGGYVLSGTLPSEPTHAPIWTWQSGKASEADVTKLASTLGLTGTPQRHSYGWELTASGGELRVRDGDGEQWSFNRADTTPCPSYQTDIDNADGAAVGFGCAIAQPAGGAITPVQGPDETTTKAAAASLLSKLNITGSEQFYTSSPSSTLSVAPQIGGMPTVGIETRVDVDAKGIRAATGRLVDPKADTDYPLQTAKDAFASLATRPMPMIAQYCGPTAIGAPVPGGPNTKFPLNPSASDAPAPAASPNTKFPLNPAASESPSGPNVKFPLNPGTSPSATGPNVKFPLNPDASASPNTVLVASPPPAPVTGPGLPGSGGPIAVPPVESAYPCPTPEPQKVTGAVIGLQVEYNAIDATAKAGSPTNGGSNILVPTWFFTVEGSTDPLTVIAVDPSFLGDQTIPPVEASAGSTSGGFAGSGGGSAGSGTTVVPPAVASVGPAVVPGGPAKPPVPAPHS